MESSKVKKRILFLTGQWADLGGLNKMIATVSGLIASEYDVTICSLDICAPGSGYPVPENVKYIEFRSSDLYQFDKIIQDYNIDIFVGSNNCDAAYLDLYKKISKLNIKTVMWNHESFFLPYTQKSLFKITNHRKEVYNYLDAIVWLTETSAMACSQYSDRVVVIGNCIQDEGSLNIKTKSDNEHTLRIISIGRFDSMQKGVGYLLLMFSELIKINSNATLTIVGKYDMSMIYSDKSRETVRQLLDRLKIPKEKIIFTGEVINTNELMAESSFNVMVSESEGFGLTVIEAAVYSIPSVVFSGGGQEDIIQDGINGLVVPYGDYALMAKLIVDIFSDKKAIKKMKSQALNLVNVYSRTTIKEKWVRLFNDLLGANQIGGEFKISPTDIKVISNYERILLSKIYDMERGVNEGRKTLGVHLANVMLNKLRSYDAKQK